MASRVLRIFLASLLLVVVSAMLASGVDLCGASRT
jgi:hypothetical protein